LRHPPGACQAGAVAARSEWWAGWGGAVGGKWAAKPFGEVIGDALRATAGRGMPPPLPELASPWQQERYS
jgi:hypothetical protein